jgi:predicted ATP-binding protein involved in virulence
MYITNLKISNFRGIEMLDIPFNKGGAVFYGINGVGKSSIIQAVNIIFSRILDRASLGKFKNQIRIQEEDVRYGSSVVQIITDIVLGEKKYEVSRSYDKKNRRHTVSKNTLNEISEYIRNDLAESDFSDLPIFVMYGVNRSVIDIPLRIRDKHSFDPISAYEKSSAGADFRVFFEWFRNQEDFENQVRANQNNGYQDSQLKAVRQAIYSIMPGFSNLMVERKPRLRMVVTKDNTKLSINQLSDGEKCYIAMIGDLARRMAIANPNAINPLLCSGIVLIDEIELHLHPEWQRKIIHALQHTFPNIQFIITTHSPQVLGEVRDMDVFKLVRESGSVTAKKVESTFGRDSDFILEQFMDTSEKNDEVVKKTKHLYELIYNNNYFEANQVINELSREVGNDDADVVKARILVARGKAKSEANHKEQPST